MKKKIGSLSVREIDNGYIVEGYRDPDEAGGEDRNGAMPSSPESRKEVFVEDVEDVGAMIEKMLNSSTDKMWNAISD